jgi:hypothetical protein
MSFIIVGIAVAAGASQIIMAQQGSKKRKAEQRAAAQELAKRKDNYEQMDTSNPYANMENTMEDLTVNTQQAQFQAQQNQQNQANTMRNMQGAAGGSGIAGLAQAMANQSAVQAQRASASIGQQEAANKKAMAQEASRLQTMERRGDARSQDMEHDKTETLLGMSQQRKGAADAARQRARDQTMQGIGTIGAAGVQAGKSYNAAEDAAGTGYADNRNSFLTPD